ncbi:hypothetical protein CGRA01v4_15063 [Colletotrichum graminicola]|uniref:Uncharacterized protein n=1 Tax=Colletotrichum graminicola (strain M1.001 / M2 / FGSC 10212) TaxID=645133 RepID=E3QZ48_COLGM|nr:uncharacterized protein GLRG_11280 [Colletotrichum graminicola M1.001]EFQ36136.1 hypothetical protein GLRG_11280 [Colletotrichum graminicola M1.001]WDK23771.1 hypothetical protein CGRA01v4_15063 [Colletotrichum graminicola]
MPSNNPRQLNLGNLIPKILTATFVLVLAILYAHTYHLGPSEIGAPLLSRQYTPPSETTVRICTALHSLRALEPDRPSSAPTPFDFFHLDARAAPFHPPRDAARIGSKNHQAVIKAVVKAGRENREMLDQSLWRGGGSSSAGQELAKAELADRASWFVTDMLIDDEARTYFLEHIQPRLNKLRTAIDAIEGLCGQMWRERGWEL